MIRDEILAREQAFFDREAAALKDEDILMRTDQIERYRRARPSALNIPKETIFTHLLPLEGKEVLDYGCGHGGNACLLAACGARVTAFDLSPISLAKARRRAELNGLAHRIRFDQRQAGRTGYPSATFDAVLGFVILHHLHTELSAVGEEIARLLKPGGTAYFVEPMANSACLRFLRHLTPVSCYATEDERQLTYGDLEPLRRHFSSLELFHYYCLEQLHRILGEWVRLPLRWLDHHTQRILPPLRRYYGDILIVANK